MQRDLLAVVTEVARALAVKGQPGTFTVAVGTGCDLVSWYGARRDEADALRALIERLSAEGYDAEDCVIAVRVWREMERSVNDHEFAVHGVEPKPETLTECERAAAAAE